MTKLKKIIAIATSVTVVTMLLPVAPVGAVTAAELQAQIDALLSQLSQLQAQLAALEGTPTGGAIVGVPAGFTFEKNLSQGMSDMDVKYLQIVLNSDPATQLAASGVGSSGNETQYFGPLTKAAVVKFQEKYAADVLAPWGLTAGTGFVGSTSRNKLNELLSAGEVVTPPGGEEPVVGEGLMVALADDNPAAATLVADSTSGDGAQSLIPMLKVKFSNGDASDVSVTQLDFTRAGISADSDISQAYLYDGDTFLAEYNSFSDTVLSFTDSSGLFTVPAGSSKTITLRVDLANGTASGKTIRFSVASVSAVSSDASAVNGDFPLNGNYMSTATASDLGELAVATTTGPASTIDPQDDVEVMNFTLAGSNQDLEVRKLKFTNIGSTDAGDLANFRLLDGGTQVGDTIASMDADKTVTFDLSSSPLEIEKGITKTMHLKADIVGGTNRTFQFTVQDMVDITVYDTQYGVFIKPYNTKGGTNTSVEDTWTVLYGGTNGAATTINTGKMTLSKASDSPSGNIAKDATNVTLGKFDIKATGEDVKITQMVLDVYGSIASNGIYQGKIYYDGVQKGSTTNLGSASTVGSATTTTFSFGNTFIVPADGNTHTLEVKGDIKKGVGNPGAAYSGNETFTVKIKTTTATGRTSSQTVSVSAATANQLTIKTGTLAVSKNQAYGDWSNAYPTAVRGQTEALVGSFILSAGASEGADVTAIQVKYSTTSNNAIQNMKLYNGTKSTGTQVGNTQGTVTGNSTYTFYPSPYISLNANEQVTINVYADVLTGAGTGNNGKIVITEADGTGKVTNTSVNYTPDVTGQQMNFASAGTLGINVDTASNPNTDIFVMGDTGVVHGKWKFSASTSAEDIHVTKIVATTTLAGSAVTSTLFNLKAYDGATQIGSTETSLADDGSVTFDLSSNPWVIPAWGEKVLTIKSDVNVYPLSTSQSSTTMKLVWETYQGAVSASTTDFQTAKSANFNNIYNTKPTVTFVGPVGATLLSGKQKLFEFKVKADDHANVNIYRFNFNFQISDNATSTNLYVDDITLYDAADLTTAVNNAVASSTSGSYVTSTVAASSIGKGGVGINDNSASTTQAVDVGVYKHSGSADDGVLMDVVPAGSEITYLLYGTVGGVGAVNEDSITVELDDWENITDSATSTSVVWGDQYTTNIPAYYIDTLPGGPSTLTK